MPKKYPSGSESPHIKISPVASGNFASPLARRAFTMTMLKVLSGEVKSVFLQET